MEIQCIFSLILFTKHSRQNKPILLEDHTRQLNAEPGGITRAHAHHGAKVK